MEEIKQFQNMIDTCENIVFFGGAGVSTESGIPDFRGEQGLYRYTPEEVISHNFFVHHTEAFFDFYKNKMMFLDARPGFAHEKLAELEKCGKLSAVVTQNIDGLHQMAGSENVLELHGSIHRNFCCDCHKFFDAAYVKNSPGVPRCDVCGGIVKPDVVLYGESLDENVIRKSVQAIAQADMLIIGGTSLVVYPAAGFVDYFTGKHLVLINKTPTARDDAASLVLRAPIGSVMRQICVR